MFATFKVLVSGRTLERMWECNYLRVSWETRETLIHKLVVRLKYWDGLTVPADTVVMAIPISLQLETLETPHWGAWDCISKCLWHLRQRLKLHSLGTGNRCNKTHLTSLVNSNSSAHVSTTKPLQSFASWIANSFTYSRVPNDNSGPPNLQRCIRSPPLRIVSHLAGSISERCHVKSKLRSKRWQKKSKKTEIDVMNWTV